MHPVWTHTCAAVIPCLNEAAGIAGLVAGVRRHLPRVLVIDDGSTDGTAAEATRAGALVLRLDTPQGKGAALAAGWRHAAGLGCRWAMTLDGDGQHDPASIPAFLARAEAGPVHLVVGNRMNAPGRMPWPRRWVNQWVSRRLSQRTGWMLPDALCGYRLIHLPSWEARRHQTRHFQVESEVLIRFLAADLTVAFIDVPTLYGGEQSKIRPVLDTLRWLRWYRGQGGGRAAGSGRGLIRDRALGRAGVALDTEGFVGSLPAPLARGTSRPP